MIKDQVPPKNRQAEGRDARLAQALRANLRRRKAAPAVPEAPVASVDASPLEFFDPDPSVRD